MPDWLEEQAVSLETTVINLKSRGFNPLVISGETLYKQADYVYEEAKQSGSFGRPIVSKMELELSGNQILIVDGLEAPERPSHLWYLFGYLLFPRALAGKANIFTTPLSYQEFIRYGESCADLDFCGRPINWEKLFWFIEATTISQDLFKVAREEGIPPMLKAEYLLYSDLRGRGLGMIPQHVLGDYLLDFALVDKERRLNVECDLISPLAGHNMQTTEAKRDLVLLSDGWQIVKFSSAELMSNPSGCADVVEDIWRSGRKRSYYGRLQTGNIIPATTELPVDDPEQRQAINHGGGPITILGGSGTGKTTCIIHRAAYLLSQAVSPEKLLLITYSDATARALKASLQALVGKSESQRMNVFSWHDLGLKILRENLPAIKRKPPLKIEPSPQKAIQRLFAKSKKELDPLKLEMSDELDEFYIAAVISMYKAHLVSARQAKEDAQNASEELIAKVYQAYEDQLQKANRIDRDDIISLSVQVLLDNQEIRKKYQSAYEFVFVDECQESTMAQDMLARLLAAPQDNIFFAGDEDETISEQKNACPDLLTETAVRFPFGLCLTMAKNWRCHPSIVEHARQIIFGLTRRRVQKDLISAWGQAPGDAVFGPYPFANEQEECAWVVEEIKSLLQAGRVPGHIAILHRSSQYENILEEELRKAEIRYLATPLDNSLVPDEQGDMLAFLKLVSDPDGPKARESFERICQLGTKDIDPKLSATIASFADANTLSYLKSVEIYAEATADQSCRELEQLVKIIRAMNQDKLPPSESIGYLRRVRRLNDYYKSIKVPPGIGYEPLKKLSQIEDEARKYTSVTEFVKQLESRLQDDDTASEEQAVQVKSVVDAKGHEFPVVFLIGLSQGLFPPDSCPDPEEESRLFYLAFTRAREALYLSYSHEAGGRMRGPSSFLVNLRLAAPLSEEAAQAQQAVQAQQVAQAQQAAQAQQEAQAYQDALAQQAAQIEQEAQLQQAALAQQAAQMEQEAQLQQAALAQQAAQTQETVIDMKPEQPPAAPMMEDFAHPPAIENAPVIQETFLPEPAQSNGLQPYTTNPEPLKPVAYNLPPSKQNAPSRTNPVSAQAFSAPEKANPPVSKPPEPPTQPAANSESATVWMANDYDYSIPPANIYTAASVPQTQFQAPVRGQAYKIYAYPGQLEAWRKKGRFLNRSLARQTQVESNSESLSACAFCQEAIEPNARFCGGCGQAVVMPKPVCVACGNQIEENSKFCGECGTVVQPKVAAPAKTAKAVGSNKKESGWALNLLKFLEK